MASDEWLPAHHHAVPAATNITATSASSNQPTARTARGARRRGGCGALDAPALKSAPLARPLESSLENLPPIKS